MSRLNMNMNMNMNMAALGVSPGRPPGRVRFNTQDYRKFINAANPILPAGTLPQFHKFWDAELRSYVYLREFIENNAGWFNAVRALADADDPFSAANLPNLDDQILGILNLAPDREERFAEIIDQHEAEGAISYFLAMLSIDPSHHPKTYLLVRVARRVGELVAMCLKEHYRRPRPSQLCPLVEPMLDQPDTPSYPSGHSLQARLIARCLDAAWPDYRQRHVLLTDLPTRIGENRVIAGIHYPLDAQGGMAAADGTFALLNQVGTAFDQLVVDAAAEFRPA
jgi:PAP2 superfamily